MLPIPGNRPCSDHAPFYSRGIPVIHFLTLAGMRDLHQPTDTADKLDYEGIRRIALLATDLAVALAEAEKRPEFVSEGFQSSLLRGVMRMFGEAAKELATEKPKPADDATPPKKKDESKSSAACVPTR